jgi:hypothetical protein
MTPSGMCGVLNDAISIYFADATLASAFVARWCAGSNVKSAEGVLQDDLFRCHLMREHRSRHPALEASPLRKWRSVSLSAKLMVDQKSGARAVIRDTHADGGRFLWSVLGPGQMDPMSDGRTDDIAQAQSLAEVALHAYAENGVEVPWHQPGALLG